MIDLSSNPNRPHRSARSGFSGKKRIVQTLASMCLLGACVGGGNLAMASNILLNPGFETSPIFNAWQTHSTESWSQNGANTAGKLYRTGANALWTQGLYLNGGAPTYYNMYTYQKI